MPYPLAPAGMSVGTGLAVGRALLAGALAIRPTKAAT